MTEHSKVPKSDPKTTDLSPTPPKDCGDCCLPTEKQSVLESRRAKLSTRYRKTFKARLEMEKRLIKRQKLLELWITFTSSSMMVVTLLNLHDPSGPFLNASLILGLLSFITLIGSLLLSAARLPERRIEAFQTYRAVQKLRVRVDQLPYQECICSWDSALTQIEKEYESLIDSTENHTEADHFRALLADRRASAFEKVSSIPSNRKVSTENPHRHEKAPDLDVPVGNREKLQWYWFLFKDNLDNNWPYAIFIVPFVIVVFSLVSLFR